jgi:hypothetical protein
MNQEPRQKSQDIRHKSQEPRQRSEALNSFCDALVLLHKSTLTKNLVRVSLGEERIRINHFK